MINETKKEILVSIKEISVLLEEKGFKISDFTSDFHNIKNLDINNIEDIYSVMLAGGEEYFIKGYIILLYFYKNTMENKIKVKFTENKHIISSSIKNEEGIRFTTIFFKPNSIYIEGYREMLSEKAFYDDRIKDLINKVNNFEILKKERRVHFREDTNEILFK